MSDSVGSYVSVKAGDWDSLVVWRDATVVQIVVIANELTWFYLSEEGFSLHWLSVGLVRHMYPWGKGLIQWRGHGSEDLSQSSESLWRQKAPAEGFKVGQSVCLSLQQERSVGHKCLRLYLWLMCSGKYSFKWQKSGQKCSWEQKMCFSEKATALCAADTLYYRN